MGGRRSSHDTSRTSRRCSRSDSTSLLTSRSRRRKRLARLLGIEHTRFVRSSELGVDGGKTERLVRIMQHVGATRYVSGPSARGYIDPDVFASSGIALEYKVYDYPPYEQLHPPYDPQVSVLDLLFMKGPDAPRLIWARQAG